jgi:hypothetical protein
MGCDLFSDQSLSKKSSLFRLRRDSEPPFSPFVDSLNSLYHPFEKSQPFKNQEF